MGRVRPGRAFHSSLYLCPIPSLSLFLFFGIYSLSIDPCLFLDLSLDDVCKIERRRKIAEKFREGILGLLYGVYNGQNRLGANV